MSFTSVLTAAGKGAVKGLSYILPFLNLGAQVTAGTPVGDGLAAVAGVATTVEGLAVAYGNATGSGAQKFQAALPYATAIITNSLVAGKEIADKDKFNKGCSEILQGVVDVLNSLKA